MCHDLGTSKLVIVASLYVPLPKTSVTLYGPSQFAASLSCPGNGGPMFVRQRTGSPFSKLRGITPLLYLLAIFHFNVASRTCDSPWTSLMRSTSFF